MRKHWVFALLSLGLVHEAYSDVLKDFDSLGGNDVLLERARALQPEMNVKVVQERTVRRRNRLEVAPEASFVVGGDSYNRTTNVGVNLHYHIIPQFGVGIKYNYSMNQLSEEGEWLIKDTSVGQKGRIPDVDWPKQQYLGLLYFYPMYGKINLLDQGVVQFDLYALAGGGQIELKSGTVPTYTAGGGIGLWISQYLSARFEARYQTYEATRFNGKTRLNTTVLGVQLGWMI